MKWSDVISDPNLTNQPYKVELNEYGQILMTPHSIHHSLLQEAITDELKKHSSGGHTPPEFAIHTTKGTKSADVVWCSNERLRDIRASGEHEALIAPEICIEVLSASNTKMQMLEKGRLYFEVGAYEFWLCDKSGKVQFFTANGEIERSSLIPGFPKQVNV